MRKAVALAIAVLVSPLVLAIGVATLAMGEPALGGEATEEARTDIPAELLSLYVSAADTCPGLSWSVIAAVAKVETDHGRFAGAQLQLNGDVQPPIIGLPLNGASGTRAIRDTDGGRLDGDSVWDRAVGPLQFIPGTWATYGVDANGDGVADPHNFNDAVHAAARYLCANGGGVAETLRTAVLAYNHADWYADEVLSFAERYAQPVVAAGSQIVGDYALPVPRELLDVALLRRPHHDYPAWDLAVPIGTPVYAAHRGTVLAVINDGRCGRGVVIAGLDGARYTYCHGDAVNVARGQVVAAGSPIMRSGNTGRSTGPHLHLQIHSSSGALVCPQPLLESWYIGRAASPSAASVSGCTS